MKEIKIDDSFKLYNGDSLEVLDTLEENSVGSIVTDPPYELGFMGKSWDDTGIANNVKLWEKAYRVLKPGGYLLAFGGTRTFHRMTCAIEDAGFEIRDCIMWLYGSGFPKSFNVGLAIDKANGVESIDTGVASPNARPNSGKDNTLFESGTVGKNFTIKKATNKWGGWGTCLKPAYEPIIVARKPLKGTIVENIEEYGVGAINIDECRIPFVSDSDVNDYNFNNSANERTLIQEGDNLGAYAGGWKVAKTKRETPNGRFPANVIHDNSEEATKDMPDSKGASSQNNYSNGHIYRGQSFNESNSSLEGFREWYNDDGSASRFFKSCEYSNKDKEGRFPANVIHDGSEEAINDMPVSDRPNGSISKPYKINNQVYSDLGYCKEWDAYQDSGSASRYFYCAKATKKDRDEGLDGFADVKVYQETDQKWGYGNTNDDNFGERVARVTRKNIHPTVKPTTLIQYLVRLVTPKGETVLDIFNGSGSTGKAVAFENRERNAHYKYIGIELEEEYCNISQARIFYAINDYVYDVEPVVKEDGTIVKEVVKPKKIDEKEELW